MTSNHLQVAFERAKRAYPDRYISGYGTEWQTDLFDEDEPQEVFVPHTWRLVDAIGASFRTPEREGMLVLQEHRPGCETAINHWGFMVSKQEMQVTA